jgi:hypothetical protein
MSLTLPTDEALLRAEALMRSIENLANEQHITIDGVHRPVWRFRTIALIAQAIDSALGDGGYKFTVEALPATADAYGTDPNSEWDKEKAAIHEDWDKEIEEVTVDSVSKALAEKVEQLEPREFVSKVTTKVPKLKAKKRRKPAKKKQPAVDTQPPGD